MRIPSECPVCGAYSLQHDREAAALLAVCDVLAVKALESLGKWLVRADRSRFATLGSRPKFIAHTIWTPDDALVSKALKGAWDVIPALLATHGVGDATVEDVVGMLDSYVHDLAITGTLHTVGELQYRFEDRLGLPVYLREVDDVPAG